MAIKLLQVGIVILQARDVINLHLARSQQKSEGEVEL